jgi:hypothetical protein
MRKLALAVVCLSMSVPEIAFAQNRGTPQEQRACRGDVAKHCKGGAQDENAILACLVSNRDKLTKACQSVLTAHGH